jgi:hypothetical protein
MGFSLTKKQKVTVLDWYLKCADSKSACEDNSVLGITDYDYRAARDEVDSLLEKVFDLAIAALKRGEL